MIHALVLSYSMATVSVPPGEMVVNHAHPAHFGQPTIRVFERRAEDEYRKQAWQAYCRELDRLWAEYRATGGTVEGWRAYTVAAGEAKQRYVFGDPYFAPIVGVLNR